MDIEELQKDKAKLENSIRQSQINTFRLEGALVYVVDNIKLEEEKEDARNRTDQKNK